MWLSRYPLASHTGHRIAPDTDLHNMYEYFIEIGICDFLAYQNRESGVDSAELKRIRGECAQSYDIPMTSVDIVGVVHQRLIRSPAACSPGKHVSH